MLRYVPGFLFLAAIFGFFLFLRFLDYQVRRDRQKRLAQLAALPVHDVGLRSELRQRMRRGRKGKDGWQEQ